jgi:methylenetetrahydrofolate dehydrogenase (NADP+)/methenyltetrahydrofolate cyclohydrolase
VIEILKRSNLPISGQHAVVVGRSDIVGKPLAMLLLHQNATVTICHSKTRDLGAVTREADILVAAIGRPGFIEPEMVKPGSPRAKSSIAFLWATPSAKQRLPSADRRS